MKSDTKVYFGIAVFFILLISGGSLFVWALTRVDGVGDDYCKSIGYDKGGSSYQSSPEGYSLVRCCDWNNTQLEYNCVNKLIEVNWWGEKKHG